VIARGALDELGLPWPANPTRATESLDGPDRSIWRGVTKTRAAAGAAGGEVSGGLRLVACFRKDPAPPLLLLVGSVRSQRAVESSGSDGWVGVRRGVTRSSIIGYSRM